ncbi:MAG TPA: hypothetical protein VGG84_00825 [Gemmatimonadaceae bacterium]
MTSPTPYALPADVQKLPRMSGYSSDACTSAIAWAQSVVEDYTERVFGAQTGTVALLDPHPGERSLLDDPPVTNVTKVEGFMAPLGGTMAWQDVTDHALWTERGEVYDATGLPGYPWLGGPTWPALPQSLRVTYDHGYADIPAAVKAAVVKLAGEYLPNPEAYIEKRIGDNTYRWLQAVLGETMVGLGQYTLVGIA